MNKLMYNPFCGNNGTTITFKRYKRIPDLDNSKLTGPIDSAGFTMAPLNEVVSDGQRQRQLEYTEAAAGTDGQLQSDIPSTAGRMGETTVEWLGPTWGIDGQITNDGWIKLFTQ